MTTITANLGSTPNAVAGETNANIDQELSKMD